MSSAQNYAWAIVNLQKHLRKAQILFSEDDKCYYPDAFLEGIKSYHGKLNSTTNGRDCVNWSDNRVVNHDDNFNPDIETNVIEDALLGDHNYCRNPDNDPNGHWCFVEGAEGDFLTQSYCKGIASKSTQSHLRKNTVVTN